MTDAYTRAAADLRTLADRIEALKDPATLAGAQAELERQVALLTGHVVNLGIEVREIPEKFEQALNAAFDSATSGLRARVPNPTAESAGNE